MGGVQDKRGVKEVWGDLTAGVRRDIAISVDNPVAFLAFTPYFRALSTGIKSDWLNRRIYTDIHGGIKAQGEV